MSDNLTSILNAFHNLLFVFTKEGIISDYSLELKGETQWYVAVISKMENGGEPRYLGAVSNITTRKNNELLLQEIFNITPAAIMVFQTVRDSRDRIIDFEITTINKSTVMLTGVSEDKLIGQKLVPLLPDQEKKDIESYENGYRNRETC